MIKTLEELLDHELKAYSQWEYLVLGSDYDTDTDVITVEVKFLLNKNEFNVLRFGIHNDKDVYVEINECTSEKIEWWDSSIKYFWMALLNWE